MDTPVPSQFAHELLNANPYAFLDEAGLEERRARAVSLHGTIPASVRQEVGKLDKHAIDSVRGECWPDLRDEHELHDLLMSVVIFPTVLLNAHPFQNWSLLFDRLICTGRAQALERGDMACWVATEQMEMAEALWPSPGTKLELSYMTGALKKCVQGWLQLVGPTTAPALEKHLSIPASSIFEVFVGMESQGLLMRGAFEKPAASQDLEVEWCERRILQRIHRMTLSGNRKRVEAVSPSVYMRWLLEWHHVSPQSQLTGEDGLFGALIQLEGFEAPAIECERSILPARIANYDPRWLDQLCLSGAVGWGRVSPHPAWSMGEGSAPQRVNPSSAAPITFFIRDSARWLPYALAEQCVEENKLALALSGEAMKVRELLLQRGACFADDIQRLLALTRQQTHYALWELAAAGLAAADGFDQLRTMVDPTRKSPSRSASMRYVRSTAGRWSLFTSQTQASLTAMEEARRADAGLESAAMMLLARYGVVFRDLLQRESNIPKWRELLGMFRRLEDRRVVRGGRFVTSFGENNLRHPRPQTVCGPREVGIRVTPLWSAALTR